MTRMQKTEETITEYVHGLNVLAEECEFETVTAEEHKDGMTRDAFINDLISLLITQRLIEEDTLDLKAAVKRAEILERAKAQADSYNKCYTTTLSAVKSKDTPQNALPTAVASAATKPTYKKCFFFLWRKV